MLSRTRRLPLGGLLFLVMAVAVGCGGQEGETAHQAEGAESHAAETTPAGDATVQAEMMTILAAADAVDGTEDKVVAKCAGCKLGMDGSADHALNVEQYEMHFCGADCKSRFEENTEQSVMAMKESTEH